MSSDQYFEDFRIPPDSPLLRYISIEPGSYHATWSASSKTLSLKKHHGKRIISFPITLEQLTMILMAVQSQRDKFTSEEIKIREEIKRKKSPAVAKDYQSHHIIPIDVCKNSKIILNAKPDFKENDSPNRVALPIVFHNGSHPKYSGFIQGILEDEWFYIVEDEAENDKEPEVLNHSLNIDLKTLPKSLRIVIDR